MHILHFIPISLLIHAVGCSSMTDSGLTKREIRAIRSAVSQQTTSPVSGLTRKPDGVVEVLTDAPESFLLRRTPDGWKVVSRETQQWTAPKNL